MPRKPKLRKIRIDWKESRLHWGMAYPDEWRIELDPRMSDETLLDVASHETIHIIAPYLDEEAVDLIGRHIGSVLARLGFRRGE